MSSESRFPVGRRGKNEPDRPDYSEPDFSGWAEKLDAFKPVDKSGAKPAAKAAPAAAAAAPAPAEVVAATPAPAADERPSLDTVLEKLLSFDGAMCVAVVDSETGMTLGSAGSGVDIDLAAAGASGILRARLASSKALGGKEEIDDVLISLTSQVQIIHPLPRNPTIFTFLIGDRAKSSLAMARFKAAEADLLIKL
jgi:hypothetical protein